MSSKDIGLLKFLWFVEDEGVMTLTLPSLSESVPAHNFLLIPILFL